VTLLSLDGSFLRNLARWGSRGPEWFVRSSPPLVGVAACVIATESRKQVLRNLRLIRGNRGALADTLDTARTFATYASCLAEILGAGSARGRLPRAVVIGEPYLQDAMAEGRGVVLVTAHTAGWETVGPLLARDHSLPVMIVEGAERDPSAHAIQDAARKAHGLLIAYAGEDPFSALPLAKHLRAGGAVALQVDRVPSPLRGRAVTMFGSAARVPEGPLRLAMLTGAPIVPVFAARTGYRRYDIVAYPAIRIARHAAPADLDIAAQTLAGTMERFLAEHPTQWFHFRGD
jgi:phosphatidylinositol dimannoside acyltransferase